MSEEIRIDNKDKNVEDFVKTYAPYGYFFIKCGCGVFATDYPFIGECRKCGYKYAGSREEIKKAKMEGNYMTILKPEEVPVEKRSALIEQYEREVNFFDPFNPED
jgi:hypothetical protein